MIYFNFRLNIGLILISFISYILVAMDSLRCLCDLRSCAAPGVDGRPTLFARVKVAEQCLLEYREKLATFDYGQRPARFLESIQLLYQTVCLACDDANVGRPGLDRAVEGLDSRPPEGAFLSLYGQVVRLEAAALLREVRALCVCPSS